MQYFFLLLWVVSLYKFPQSTKRGEPIRMLLTEVTVFNTAHVLGHLLTPRRKLKNFNEAFPFFSPYAPWYDIMFEEKMYR